MVQLESTKYDELMNSTIRKFINLRKYFEGQVQEAVRRSKGSNWEVDRKIDIEVAESVLSQESFESILPKDAIEVMKNHQIGEMFKGEDALHKLAGNVLKAIDSKDYDIEFWHMGRCKSCGKDTETIIMNMGKPVLDSLLENNPDYFNELSDRLRCGNCNKVTDSIKTGNIYAISGNNDYNLKLILVRRKSGGRLITKIVQLCSGKDKYMKAVSDSNGMMNVCNSGADCKKMPELFRDYHSKKQQQIYDCRDFFVVNEVTGKDGKTRYESQAYNLYWDKNGLPKKTKVHPIEARRREKDGIVDFYKALHFPIKYKGITIGVQVKTMDNWVRENDPESPLYHGTYKKGRPECTIYREEMSEAMIKAGWGEFERRLQNYLIESSIFNPFNPDLYLKDMILW